MSLPQQGQYHKKDRFFFSVFILKCSARHLHIYCTWMKKWPTSKITFRKNKIYFPSLNPGEGFGGQNLHQVANPPPEDKTIACTVVTHFNLNI